MQQNHPLTPKLKLMQLEPNVLNIIIPTPGKKMSGQKCRKKQETRHDNSDVYFKQTLAKRKLKVEKEGNAKSIPKKKQHRASNIKGVFPDLHEESDENTPCGCCGLKLRSVQSVQKGDWIRCHQC